MQNASSSLAQLQLTVRLTPRRRVQGTNAHVILETSAPAAGAGTGQLPAAPAVADQCTWHKRHHWVLPRAYALLGPVTSAAQQASFTCQLASPRLSYLLDHAISGRAVFPAAGYLEAAASAALVMGQPAGQAGAGRLALVGATLPAALLLTGWSSGIELAVELTAGGEVAVASRAAGGKHSTTHLIAHVAAVLGSGKPAAAPGPAWLRRLMAPALVPSGMLVQGSDSAAGSAAARLASEQVDQLADHLMHPALLDCALQLAAVAPLQQHTQRQQEVQVPVSLAACVLPEAGNVALQHVTAVTTEGSTSYELMDGSGRAAVSIAGLAAKAVGRVMPAPAAAAASAAADQLLPSLYQVSWQVADPGPEQSAVMDDEQLHLQLPAAAADGAGVRAASTLLALLQTQQALPAAAAQQLLRLVAVESSTTARRTLPGSMMLAIARSAAVEGLHSVAAAAQLDELSAAAAPALLARASVIAGATPMADPYGSRLLHGAQLAARLLPAPQPETLSAHQLVPSPRGSFGSLVPVPVSAAELGAGQVALAVKALGLNFRQATCFVHLLLVLLAAA